MQDREKSKAQLLDELSALRQRVAALEAREQEWQQKEQALRFQSMLLNQIQDRITATDLEGHITYINAAECRTLKKSREELLGRHIGEYGEDPARGATQRHIVETTLSEGEWRGEVVNFTKDGKAVILDARTQLVRADDGQPVGMVGISTDITELKQAEARIHALNKDLESRVQQRTAQLQAANKELQDFAYIVSHDLKSPLRGISQLAHWLLADYAHALDEQGRNTIAMLLARVKRMENLINGILQYSRIGRITEKEQPLELNELLHEVVDSLAPPDHIRIVLEDPLPVIQGDKIKMTQVFQNLIGNAIKFMDKPQGKISVRCKDQETHWQFSVTDNGPGIAEKYHKKIFQIFQTLDARDIRESTGIGLAVVKKIVEHYGGTIGVESTNGTGATFYLTFPKAEVSE